MMSVISLALSVFECNAKYTQKRKFFFGQYYKKTKGIKNAGHFWPAWGTMLYHGRGGDVAGQVLLHLVQVKAHFPLCLSGVTAVYGA